MSENGTVLKRTFALTAQRREGTVVLLDVQAKIRKIPASVISDDDEQIHITTDPRYLPDIENSVGFVLKPKEEPCETEEEPEEEAINNSGDRQNGEAPKCDQQTLIIDLTISDDEEDAQSDTTEVNPDVPPAVPLIDATTSDVARTPQPPKEEQPHPAPTERVPSPSPPCYHPPQHFQHMYAPPILLQSEEEYKIQREILIQQYLRDSLDLYYKYEFQALKLKRARHVLNNRKY